VGSIADAYVKVKPQLDNLTQFKADFAAQAGEAGFEAGNQAARRLNERLRALDLPRIPLNVSPEEALTKIELVKHELEKLAREAPTARIRVDAEAGLAEMERFKTLLELKSREAGEAGGKAATQGFQNGFDRGSSVFSTVAGIVASKMALIGIAAAAATPSVASLGASLLPLAGSLVAAPALLGGAAAALGVFKLATQGTGQAIKDGLSGNWKAFAKDLQDMPAQQAQAVQSIVALRGAFQELRNAVGNNFWGPINTQLGTLIHNILPVLQGQLPNIARAMGDFAASAMHAASSGTFLRGLNDVLGGTAQAIYNARGGAEALVHALGLLFSAGAPALGRLGQLFTDLAQKFDQFITRASQTGQLTKWLNDAWRAADQLVHIFVNLAEILASVFKAANSAGGLTLTTLVNLTQKAKEFFASAQGQNALTDVFHTLNSIGSSLGTTLLPVLKAVAEALHQASPALQQLAPLAANLIIALTPILPLFTGIAARLITAVLPALNALANILKAHPALVNALAVGITALVAGMKAMTIIETVTGFLRGFGVAMAGLKLAEAATTAETKGFTAAINANKLAFLTSPWGIVIIAIIAVGVAVFECYKHFKTFRDIIHEVWTWIKANWPLLVVVFLPLVGVALEIIKHWNTLKQVGVDVWHALNTAWNAVLHVIQDVFNWIKGNWPLLLGILLGPIATAVALMATHWNWLWHNVVEPVWHGIQATIQAAGQFIGNIFQAIWGAIQFLGSVFLWLYNNAVRPVWQAIMDFIRGAAQFIGAVLSAIEGAIQFLGSVFEWLWNNIVHAVWQAIMDFIHAAASVVGDIINALVNAIRFLGSVFDWLYNNVIHPVWQAIVDFIHAAANFIGNVFQAIMDAVHFMADTFGKFRDVIHQVWDDISSHITSVWHTLENIFNTLIHVVKDLVVAAFHEAADGIKAAWDKIMGYAKDPVNFVIGTVYNHGVVPVWNFIASKVGLEALKEMPTLATGGLLNGPGTSTSDSIPAMLSDGEYVVNAKQTKKYLPVLNAINYNETKTGDFGFVGTYYPPGYSALPNYCAGGMCDTGAVKKEAAGGYNEKYAGGGPVIALNFAAGGVANADAVIEKTKQWLQAQAGKPYVMGAAGPGAWDCSGLVGGALKMINGQDPNGRIFSTVDEDRFFQGGFGGVNDLNVGWEGGAGGDGHTVGSIGGLNFEATPPRVLIGNVQTTPGQLQHRGHAVVGGGVAYSDHGGGGSFCIPNPISIALHKIYDEVVGHLIEGWLAHELAGPLGFHPEMHNGTQKINDAIKAKMDQLIPPQICIKGNSGGAEGGAGGKAWEALIKQALQMLGLPESWVGGVETIISRESSGNPRIVNNTDSNAAAGNPSKGLMQTTGQTFAAYHVAGHDDILDPLSNILAGLRYIQARYGDISNVQQANPNLPPKGYDNGGVLPTGWSTVYNGTGRPENVSSADKMDDVIDELVALRRIMRDLAPDVARAMGSPIRNARTTARLGG
jgi:SLT domain-containing protein/phage-related protein